MNFITNGNSRLNITSDGNVGIGTDSPAAKLNVVGSAAENGISIKSGGNGGVDPFKVTWASGTEGDMFVVDDAGRVGIGISSPLYKFHTQMPSDGSIGAVFRYTGGTNNPGLFLSVNESTTDVVLDGSGSTSANLVFKSTGVEVMRLNPSGNVDITGNVGIGTGSPDQELHIKVGDGGFISSGAAREGAVIRLEHDQQWESGYGTSGTDFLGGIEFATGDTSTGVGVRAAIKSTVDSYFNTNSLTFYTAPAATAGILERMRIDGKGMIGVQSAMPADVSGDCTSIRVGGLSVLGGTTGTSGKQNFHTGLYYNAYPTSASTNKALVSKGSGNDYRPVKYVQKSGGNTWYNAGSATAGSDITWTQRMSLDHNGILSLYNGTNNIYSYVRAPGGVMGTFFAGSVNNSSADYDITHLNPATNNVSGAFLMTSRETSSPSLGLVRTFILFLNDTGIATTQLSGNGSTAASLSFSRPNETTLRVTASNYNVHYINIIPIAGAQF